jgi:hypothetical protein
MLRLRMLPILRRVLRAAEADSFTNSGLVTNNFAVGKGFEFPRSDGGHPSGPALYRGQSDELS